MGRLVADAGKRDWDELTAEYGAMLMEGLGVMGTRGKHVHVLQHLMGYLKKDLSSEDKAYRWYVGAPVPHRGLSPGARATDRAADVAAHLLKHHLNRYPVPEWVYQQPTLGSSPDWALALDLKRGYNLRSARPSFSRQSLQPWTAWRLCAT